MAHLRIMSQVVGGAIQSPERCVVFGIEREFDCGFAPGLAVAGVSPRNLQIFAVDPCSLLGFLHEESPVHAAPEVGDIQRVDAVAFDHRRGSIEDEPLFSSVQDGQNREADDHKADQKQPGAGLQEGQNADDGPCDRGQGG